jgi:cell division protein ZapA (FtsZ GTPase activity inhibitor)
VSRPAAILTITLLVMAATLAMLEFRLEQVFERLHEVEARIARMERRAVFEQQATERLLTGLESRLDAMAHRVRERERADLTRQP